MTQKTALVVGGGSDIGAATVQALHDAGWNVIWTYFHTNRDQPGVSFQVDLTDIDQVHKFLHAVPTNLDLIVTAAIPFWEAGNTDFYSDPGSYTKMEPFLRAHMLLMTEGSKLLNKGGKIINMLGQCVNHGIPGASFYSAVFAYIHNWGKATHKVEGRQGIFHVCNFLLGPVNTREWDSLSDEMVEEYQEKVYRFIESEEVASYVVFIANSPMTPDELLMSAYY